MVVQMLAGPGAGKSTIALGVTYELKKREISCEYLHEYAKDLTYRGDQHTLEFQPYVTVKQLRFLRDILNGGVQVVVTDTSPLLSLVYGEGDPTFHKWILKYCSEIPTLSFFIDRGDRGYNRIGRT